MSTSVCWTSYADPESLVTVGPNAVALLCQNIVFFYNVKTRAKNFYTDDSPESCAGISLLAGHPQYPLFAIAEQALRPSIYVMNYPEMEKLTHIPPSNDLYYIDLHLSEYLIALSGAPDYMLRSWNYRTGILNASKKQKKCEKHCLYPLGVVNTPVILYSVYDRDVSDLETCPEHDSNVFHIITRIKMGDDYEKSTKFNVAWMSDDPYVVNDYGAVSLISSGSFAFKPQWKPPHSSEEPRAYRIFSRSNISFLVTNETTVYCIKKQPEWFIEWRIENMISPIIKMVVDFYGNIYATTCFGNVYYVDSTDKVGSLRELAARNCDVQSYCFLKEIKEEIVLLLTGEGELRLVDILSMNIISWIYIKDACCMESHDSYAIVAVGTSKGTVHFISYEKYREPIKLGSLDIDNMPIEHLKLFHNITFVVNVENAIDILICDFKNSNFCIGMSLERDDNPKLKIIKIFLLDSERAAIFVSHERNTLLTYSECLWLVRWHSTNLSIMQQEFKLPNKYSDVTLILPCNEKKVHFMGLRLNSCIIDRLLLNENRELIVQYSVRNQNYGNFNRIRGTGNVLTSAATGIILHFQSQISSKIPYISSRLLLTSYVPYLRKLMDVHFHSKYLLVLYTGGNLMVFRLISPKTSLNENEILKMGDRKVISAFKEKKRNLRSQAIVLPPKVTQKDIELKKSIIEELISLRKSMFELIHEDITGTGHRHGVFRKFCVNTIWLAHLTANAKAVCKNESDQMLRAIQDQNRIRIWILDLIRSSKSYFSTKLHSVFSKKSLENYATTPSAENSLAQLDKVFMNDLEIDEAELEFSENRKSFNETDPEESQTKETHTEEIYTEECYSEEVQKSIVKQGNHFNFEKGQNVFEYIMSNDFDIQDINIVSNYQMYSEDWKLQIMLINVLKEEFNKLFADAKNLKHKIFDYISKANAELQTIYSNMNCMLELLDMDEYNPPALLLPEWKKDEFIERILTVDDSEITAVNHRRNIMEEAPYKRGRMLLWSDEFFSRAIMSMMDGTVEKLWEEEIKKTPILPESLEKKRPIELTIEERNQLIAFEQTLKKLQEDRRRYLEILKENESKTLNRKNHQISKLNEIVAGIAVLKLKYDFAVKREQLCLLNTKKINFERIQCKKHIIQQRERLENLNLYAYKYGKLLEYWSRTFLELKMKLDNQIQRDRQLERQFKVTYINSIPAHLSYEMNKIYKRRPKLPAKALSSASVSNDVHERIMLKKQHKFPLPDELNEFLGLLDGIDDIQNCPYQLEHKYWEQFVKLRRQKFESAIRLKAIGYSILDAQTHSSNFTTNLNKLKLSRADLMDSMTESVETYFDTTQNRSVVVTLSMGQIEADIFKLDNRTNTILHVDDIANVNAMINEAGMQKIASMQRVAFFRRQVIYKEWEHQAMRANIEYLKYVLKLVENCKVPHEILQVCRNWNSMEDNNNSASTVGAIETELAKKKEISEENLKSIDKKLEKVRADLRAKRAANNALDRKIDNLKIDISKLSHINDPMKEDKLEHERKQRFGKFLKHHKMVETVRRDYVQILELTTILELQRLRTYPTLGPAPQSVVRDQ